MADGEPATGHRYPAAQLEHSPTPVSEYVPAAQGVGGTDGDAHEKPAGHAVQFELPASE